MRPRFFDLARLKQQLDADSDVPLRQLRRRDHDLGQQIADTNSVRQLLTWLNLLGTGADDDGQAPIPNHLEGLTAFVLAVAGFILGVLAMTGLLFANPRQPVNLLVFLGLFVSLQLLFLIISLLAAYRPANQTTLHSPIAWLNPARWALKLGLRQYSHSLPWRQIPQLTRLLLLRWGQVFAMSFNLALLLSFYLALLLSDRSFGWSSTLTISDSALFNVLHGLALPWREWLDAGAISAQLVADTRFQSLQTQFSDHQIEAMRGWWPYLFCALVTYGLLPRVGLFLVFNWQYRRRLSNTLLQYPGARLVLDRLNTPVVATQARQHSEQVIADDNGEMENATGIQGTHYVVNWSGALSKQRDQRLADLGTAPQKTLTAGLQLEDDAATVARINREHPNTVVIAVKSWEPPLAELADFIAGISDNTQIVFLLVPLAGKTISADELKDWRHFVRTQLSRPAQLLRGDEAAA